MAAVRTRQQHSELVQAIMRGDHDSDLGMIQSACAARLKNTWRRGMKVRLVGTKNAEIDGKVGTVLKANTKRISVGLGEPVSEYGMTYYPDGEYNVPPSMLQHVEAS